MPSPEVLLSFREGLKIIQSVEDFATLRHTIDKMVSVCPPGELHMAKDAIARVVRAKQAVELRNSQGYPQAIEALDKKYRDLYIVLRTAQSQVAPPPPKQPQAMGGALPPPAPDSTPLNQIAKIRSLGGLNMPMMILDWLRTKRKYLIAGGAVGAVGGAYMLYKQMTSDKDDTKKNPDDSNFDKTIKSIQKYKAFSMMMNDPNFSGDYTDIINGNYKKSKSKKELKKDDDVKSISWDKEERSLMKDMDDAFNSIATKPELDYQLPQLPAPRNIDPREILGEDKPLEFKTSKPSKIKNTRSSFPEKKSRKPRKVRKPREQKVEEVEVYREPTPQVVETSEPEVKKVRKRKAEVSEETPGRLIPIVKRTKRVKKVNA